MLTHALSLLSLISLTFGSAHIALAQSQDYDVRPEARRMTGEKLIGMFTGVTHEGAYNFDAAGRPGMRYAERHFADGRIRYTEDNQVVKGQWAISPRDTICYNYDNPNFLNGCFRVYRLGTCYYFYSTALTSRPNESGEDYWTARSVKKGDRATCEDMIS